MPESQPEARPAPASPPQAEVQALIGLYNQRQLGKVLEGSQKLAAEYPRSIIVLNILGAACLGLGRFDQAAAAFGRVLAIEPELAEGHNNLGNVFKEQGKLEDAAASYARALAAKPDYAGAYCNLGTVLRAQGRLDDAVTMLGRAVAIKPDLAEAHNNLGGILHEQGNLDEAAASLRRALELRPNYAGALNNLANLLQEQCQLDEAVRIFGRALAINPGYAEAHSNLGVALRLQGRFDEAEASGRRAVAIKPDHADGHVNLGKTLECQGRFGEALASLGRALAIKPNCADTNCNIALLCLLRGQFDTGWPSYEWRKKTTKPKGARSFPQPTWLGEADVRGKSVFLHHEQGLGDTIQFVRYAALVRELGADVTVAVQEPLLPLLREAIPGVEVIGGTAVPARFDYHAPLLSLPLAFGTRLDTIPAPIPYLDASPQRIQKWAVRLGSDGFKLGICWQGRTGSIDTGRSFSISEFSGIARLPGVRLISLHKGAGESQLAQLSADIQVETLGGDFDPPGASFLDSAAVMKLCDLIITSDTSVAHLAGALGVPVWIVLKQVPDWRWMLGRDDSPWYPTMRLFRQHRRDDWTGVFGDMVDALTRLLDEGAPPRGPG